MQVARAEIDAKIATLKKDVEAIEDIDQREDIYVAIDALEKKPTICLKNTEILPEALLW
jgi:preprotein translocase subunit SecA